MSLQRSSGTTSDRDGLTTTWVEEWPQAKKLACQEYRRDGSWVGRGKTGEEETPIIEDCCQFSNRDSHFLAKVKVKLGSLRGLLCQRNPDFYLDLVASNNGFNRAISGLLPVQLQITYSFKSAK